ncbi:MAG: hypothetical protein AAF842_07660 [Planctomycetota bacterium]
MIAGLCTLMVLDTALAAIGQTRLAALLGMIVLAQALAVAGCLALGIDPLSL